MLISTTVITCLGAMVSAFMAGNFIRYGKWRMIIISNLVLMSAIILCLVGNFWIILVGRFIWGLSAGSFNCYVPAYISEIAPNEYKGPYGFLNQLAVCSGIFIAALLGLAIPNEAVFDTVSPNEFIVKGYFRVIFGVPMIICLVMLALMMTIFNFETPIVLV